MGELNGKTKLTGKAFALMLYNRRRREARKGAKNALYHFLQGRKDDPARRNRGADVKGSGDQGGR